MPTRYISDFSSKFKNPNFFPNLNYNCYCSRNLHKRVKNVFGFKNSSDLLLFRQIVLVISKIQNNFGNKIPFLSMALAFFICIDNMIMTVDADMQIFR